MTRLEELTELAMTHKAAFRRLASRVLQNYDETEDVVQDALLTAFKCLGQFKGDSKLSTWVGRIVINCALMRTRRYSGRLLRSCTALEKLAQSEVPRFVPDYVSEIDERRNRRRLYQTLSQMPKCYRIPIVLQADGIKLEQIAKYLKTSEGTIKSHVSRGRQKLKQRMGL